MPPISKPKQPRPLVHTNDTGHVQQSSRLLAVDTETTGLDFYHGSAPYFVTMCDDQGRQYWWEWDVDPLTRRVLFLPEDVLQITEVLSNADELVLQNTKFDVKALGVLHPVLREEWRWHDTHDTLIMGHLLGSNQPHDLGSMSVQYLGKDIQPYEDKLGELVKECRRWVRGNRKTWAIAKDDRPDMPSAKGEFWKADGWLPRAVALSRWQDKQDPERGRFDPSLPTDKLHPYWTVLRTYANWDSSVTAALHPEMTSWICKRGLWEIYLTRLKLLPIAHGMEHRGVTTNGSAQQQMVSAFHQESEDNGRICMDIASDLGYTLELPRAGINQSLRTFMFDVLNVERIYNKKARSAEPTLAKEAMNHYLATTTEDSIIHRFVKALTDKRKRDTALSYMEGYERFRLPLKTPRGVAVSGWYVLHPNLNPTGTDTLRWSSSNPNEQNIGKQQEKCKACDGKGVIKTPRSGKDIQCSVCYGKGEVSFNLRRCFGPAPGREWWSLDAKNIELRIPAYEAGETEMIALFEQEDAPPYYGSNHLLVAHTIHPELWAEIEREVGFDKVGPTFKKRYASTWYQWVKNGNFAVQYGAVDRPDGMGTADRAYHKPGAQAIIKAKFAKMDALNKRCIRQAEQYGYVETMPDKEVCPKRGYPLMCTRSQFGKILPTVPLNYHVQGTACWWMMKAMIRCQAKLESWNRLGFDGHMIMQVHDELVFDLPKAADPKLDKSGEDSGEAKFRTSKDSNLWRIRVIQELMAKGGDDIGIPTPVGIEYHADNWGEGVTL